MVKVTLVNAASAEQSGYCVVERLGCPSRVRLALGSDSNGDSSLFVSCAADVTAPGAQHSAIEGRLLHAPLCPLSRQCGGAVPREGRRDAAAAASIIVFRSSDDGKPTHVLLTRRPMTMRVFPGTWVLPGGHVESGETLLEAAKREAIEETGAHIKEGSATLVCVYESTYPAEPGVAEVQSHHIISYFAGHFDKSLSLRFAPDEVDAAAWVSIAALRRLCSLEGSRIEDGMIVQEDGSWVPGPVEFLPRGSDSGGIPTALTTGVLLALREWLSDQ